MHHASESSWKSDEESMSGKSVYSSIDWKIFLHNYVIFECIDSMCDCGTRGDIFASCLDSCVNHAREIECA